MVLAGFQRVTFLGAAWCLFLNGTTIPAASLDSSALKAWDQYTNSANIQLEQRLHPDKTFLWAEERPDRLKKVRAGEVVVSPVGAENPKRVPYGLIHDWIAAVFIPHTTLQDVVRVVSDYGHYKEWYPPTVISSKVISLGETKDRFSLLLMSNLFFVKNALDADFESRYVRVDERRGYSVSSMTRAQEIQNYGSPAQRELPEGEGTGILWRLFSVTRYVERDGGVYLEREVIGLSRDIPASLRWFVEPIVRRVSKESISTSLRQTESAILHSARNSSGL